MTEKHVFNIWAYAREIYAFINKYYLNGTHTIPDKEMIGYTEELIIRLIEIVIEETRAELIPRKTVIEEEDAYAAYCLKAGFDKPTMINILIDNIALDNLLCDVYELVSKNRWSIWTVNSTYIENLGDFRILQWEQEHIVDGKYVTEPIRETNTED